MYSSLAMLGSGFFFTSWPNVSLATVLWLIARLHPALSAGVILMLVMAALGDEDERQKEA